MLNNLNQDPRGKMKDRDSIQHHQKKGSDSAESPKIATPKIPLSNHLRGHWQYNDPT